MPKKPSAKPSSKQTGKEGTVKELGAALAVLESQLVKAQAKTDTWKGRARAAQADAGAVRAKVAKLEKRLEKALARAVAEVAPDRSAPAGRTAPPTTATATKAAPAAPSATPDLSWTLVRLRQEARRRGVVYTGKSKAQLLSSLG